MNFSSDKNYGIYQTDRSLVFRNQGVQYTMSGEGLVLGKYYSIGFWRRTDAFVSFINGVQRQSISLRSNISSITPCMGASGKNSNEDFFDGHIAEALVYSSNNEFSLNTGFHYNFNSRFGIINGTI